MDPDALFGTASAAGHTWYAVALAATGVWIVAALTTRPRLAVVAMRSAGLAIALATFALLRALWQVDLSLAYVADTTSRETPGTYRLAALWGAMEGSLLFWTMLQFAVLVAGLASVRREQPALARPATVLSAALVGSYLLVSRLWADPFASLDLPPADGTGLVAVLQHPAMIYHPPLLYSGMVVLAVPFVITVAAVWARTVTRAWRTLVRPWLYAAWILLTLGMLSGSHWAYVELGWGGYWAWDPVENTALLPWLLVTAALHGLLATAGRIGPPRWPAALVLGAFVVSMSGVYLTRSGGTGSIHAFAENGTIGRAVLALTVTWGVVAIAAWRRMAPPEPSPQRSARSIVFGGQALVLTAAAVVVAAGSFSPVFRDLLGGRPTIVQPDFYVTFLGPLAAATAVAAVLAPGTLGVRPVSRRLLGIAAGSGVALGAVLVAWAAEHRPPGEVLLVLVGSVAVAVGVADASASVHRHGWSLRRVGLRLAHIGFALLVVGAASTALGGSGLRALDIGATTTVEGRDITLTGLEPASTDRYEAITARLDVSHDGATWEMSPEIRAYEDQRLPTSEADVRSAASGDLMISLRRIHPGLTGATVEVFVRPLISWVWAGALLMLAGVACVAGSTTWRGRAESAAPRRPAATATPPPGGTTSAG